ncbi:MAG: tripartite tricarboxylate transporter substrate binding protein, partial [Casimicrobiaceae bacterium]
MNKQSVRFAAICAAVGAMTLAAGVARAQDVYPAKPIRIVVPFTPGTGMDILARTLGQKLGDEWKIAVVVENKAGASGNIG